MTKTIVVENVRDRDSIRKGVTHRGRELTGHHVRIIVGESVTLYGMIEGGTRYVKGPDGLHTSVPENDRPYSRTFRIGDVAEYDSYNLSYLGTIVAIGEKTIAIRDERSTRKLSLFEFSDRNHDLDLEATAKRNAETMLTI